jgi:antirestriction protein ArdC
MATTIYDIVSERILSSLEAGTIPWRKDWKDAAISWSTGKGYRGINALLLDKPGEYITWNQIKENGGMLRKGSKQRIVVLYKPITYGAVIGEDDEQVAGRTFMRPIRYYGVYHIADVEGIAPRWSKDRQVVDPVVEADKVTGEYIARSGVKLVHREQNRAYYTPATDTVTLPSRNQFTTQAGYYGTMFHELTHSTGHSSRLNRSGITEHCGFGSEDYGKEELIAEIGAAMLYSVCGLGEQPAIDNSAAYLQSWINAIRGDKKLIVTASNAAQKAADHVRGISFVE